MGVTGDPICIYCRKYNCISIASGRNLCNISSQDISDIFISYKSIENIKLRNDLQKCQERIKELEISCQELDETIDDTLSLLSTETNRANGLAEEVRKWRRARDSSDIIEQSICKIEGTMSNLHIIDLNKSIEKTDKENWLNVPKGVDQDGSES